MMLRDAYVKGENMPINCWNLRLMPCRKPKNARAARLLKKKDPLQHENPKTTLFLRSTTSSSLINALLTDLNSLKQPHSIRFTKKNSIHPFEDPSSLEFFSQRNDASLLCFGSHSKKRPHCLTFVRCFGGKILDILEATVVSDTARTLGQFGGGKCRIGAKPLLSFSGTQFENLEGDQRGKFAVAKSIFLDFFRGGETKEVDVEGLQYMINFSAGEVDGVDCTRTEMVYMRCWKLVTKRSGQKLPRVELEEMGPRIDFRLGRVTEANESMLKEALRRSESTEVRGLHVSFVSHLSLLSTWIIYTLLISLSFRPKLRRMLRPTLWETRWVEFILGDKILRNCRPER